MGHGGAKADAARRDCACRMLIRENVSTRGGRVTKGTQGVVAGVRQTYSKASVKETVQLQIS